MFSNPSTGGGFGAFGSAKPSGFSTASTFGAPASNSTFGTATTGNNTFGSSTPMFGNTGATPSFGSTSSPFGKTAGTSSTFGSTPAFGSSATTAPSFGSTPATFGSGSTTFGTALSSTPAFGSNATTAPTFGSTATTAPAFGSTATTFGTGGSTFGSTPSFGSFNNKPIGFAPAMGTPGIVNGLGVPQNNVTQEIPLETKYNDLPPPYKAEIDAIYKDCKEPLKANLNQIKRFQGTTINEWHDKLEQLRLIVVNIETAQFEMQAKINILLDEIRPLYREFKTTTTAAMSQVKSRGGGIAGGRAVLLDEELPDHLYFTVAENLEKRLVNCISTIRYFEKQLIARANVLNSCSGRENSIGTKGPYGQNLKIGAKQLLNLLKQQAEVFAHITAEVSAVHQGATVLRQYYLKYVNKSGSNPFEVANRQESLKRIELEEKLKQESFKLSKNREVQLQPSAVLPSTSGFGTTQTSTAPTGSFGTPSSGFGVMGFSNPSTTATPAANFGATGFGTTTSNTSALTTFGTNATSSFAPAATNGFGAIQSAAPAGSTSVAALDLATSGNTFGQGFGGASTGASFGGFSTANPNTSTSQRKTRKK